LTFPGDLCMIGPRLNDTGLTQDTKTPPDTIGGRLRQLRLERGFSQRDLASPGVSYAYISRIEAGARQPSVKALRKLAAKLGVSVEYLETGSDLSSSDERELQLTDLELRLRLDGDGVQLSAIEALLEDALASGDKYTATRARIILGLAAAREGDNARVISHLEQSLQLGGITAAARPDVFATLGRAYADSGEPRKAAELFEQGLDATSQEAPDDYAAHVRYATYLSFALTDLGELERARRVVQDALNRSPSAADPYTRVRLYWSLGRIAHEQAKPAAALEHFRHAVALLEMTEDTLHLARAYLSVAGSAILTGDLDDAAGNIELAERLFGLRMEPGDLAVIRRMQADLAVACGDGDEAVRRGREAVEAAGDQSPNQRGLALAAVAAGLALIEDPAADTTYREAIELLETHGTRRERNDILLTYGRYLRAVGRNQEALDVLDRAADVAVTLHDRPRLSIGP
jgi:transcriptional regulator with XRE-family HTH domain